jgi:glycosyltransferase involved in cell wall biosynthesis
MKILFVSMPSIHTIRWIDNLINANHELYWFDVLGKGNLDSNAQLTQFVNWKKRKLPYFKGEHFLQKKVPKLYLKIQPYLEVTANEKLAQIINEFKPDLIHSFEMQSCSYPILKTMNMFPSIKWLYSCWGSDLYYYKNKKEHLLKIKAALNRINYLHTDCERDYNTAKELGFNGNHVGVIPGGGGYDLSCFQKYSKPFRERNLIIVKGYHHQFGRALNVVKALEEIKEELHGLDIVIFGAHEIVQEYITENNLPFLVYDRNGLLHEEVLKLMGGSLIYVGNNISDGIPNTLLEAMVMGAFPIQSNPGGVTEEIISNENGLLIENPENILEIKLLIQKAIQNKEMMKSAITNNMLLVFKYLDFEKNQKKIISLYNQIDKETCE